MYTNNMKTLIVFDRKDYDISSQRYIKNSARAIIITNNKVAMLYSNRYKFYCFPGGSIEKDETIIETLIRETREEAGLMIKQNSIKEFGMIIEIRKDLKAENGIYEQNEYYYYCEVEENIFEQKLTQNEIEAGYELKFVTLDEAINQNELEIEIKRIYTEAETYILKLLKKELGII